MEVDGLVVSDIDHSRASAPRPPSSALNSSVLGSRTDGSARRSSTRYHAWHVRDPGEPVGVELVGDVLAFEGGLEHVHVARLPDPGLDHLLADRYHRMLRPAQVLRPSARSRLGRVLDRYLVRAHVELEPSTDLDEVGPGRVLVDVEVDLRVEGVLAVIGPDDRVPEHVTDHRRRWPSPGRGRHHYLRWRGLRTRPPLAGRRPGRSRWWSPAGRWRSHQHVAGLGGHIVRVVIGTDAGLDPQ